MDDKEKARIWEMGYQACWATMSVGMIMVVTQGKSALKNIVKPENPYESR